MKPNAQMLLDLLSNNDVTFFIPPYQRNYEWDKEQCEVFFEDVKKTSELNASGANIEHFFGSITYFSAQQVFGQPTKLVLIDGQQRITTTMLFMVALRDIIQDDALTRAIDTRYLKNGNVQSDDDEYKIKLKQVESDWNVYKKIILAEELSDKERTSPVSMNHKYFYNRLRDYKNNGGDLKSMLGNGLNKFSIVTIQLEPDRNKWENPQEIFESMNSLGKPLSLADLTRNYILLGLEPDDQENLYRTHWLRIEQKIPGRVSDFIRDYMQCREKRWFVKSTESNYKELYSSFKKIFANQSAETLLKDLADHAAAYSWIIYGKGAGDVRIDKELKDMNTLNSTTAYSFLMALLCAWKNGRFTSDDIVGIIGVFKTYCMRRRLLSLGKGENKGALF